RESGTPIGGALVISGGSTNETDAAGRAVATGSKVTAYKAGYVPLATSSESDLELKLSPGETIGGRVMDGASNAVSGAAITIIVPSRLAGPHFAVEQFPVISDSNGVWRCDFVPKNPTYVKLEFSHPNFDWYEQ